MLAHASEVPSVEALISMTTAAVAAGSVHFDVDKGAPLANPTLILAVDLNARAARIVLEANASPIPDVLNFVHQV